MCGTTIRKLAHCLGFLLVLDVASVAVARGKVGDGPSPCAALSPAGPYTTGQSIRFDAFCTEMGGSDIERYEWRFGDGFLSTDPVVERRFRFEGEYTVTLVVRTTDGAESTLERRLIVSEPAHEFEDHFERDDGELDRWTPTRGEWVITDGKLGSTASPDGAAIWAGAPPIVLENASLQTFHSVDLGIDPDSLDGADRDVAVALFASEPATRGSFRGYTIEWIDDLAVIRVTRRDGDSSELLFEGAPEDRELPTQWNLQLRRDSIDFYSDVDFFFTIDDATYRRGHLGLLLGESSSVRFEYLSVFRGHVDLAMLRGDCDGDGETTRLTDALILLSHNFLEPHELPCAAACDLNADGDIGGVTDAIVSLTLTFLGGVVVPGPFPDCGFTGLESDFELGCEAACFR